VEDGFATKVAILNRPKKLNALNENMVMATFLSFYLSVFRIIMEYCLVHFLTVWKWSALK
jgi:hypothetical protein